MLIVEYESGEGALVLDRIRARSPQVTPELIDRVSEVIESVRSEGDDALIRFTRLFDGVDLRTDQLRLEASEIEQLASRATASAVEAFRAAIRNVRAFHERQRENSWSARIDGVIVGQRVLPLESVGLYVPGGLAAYPSSLIMTAVPAIVAGVNRIAVATPPGTLDGNPIIAAVIRDVGIHEVYRIGGAQAVAALAYGTGSVSAVDKIVGPGNIYVATAKKLVFGIAGIDSIAGPTEVVVVADDSGRAPLIAADLLAQAEHDTDASSVCITTSRALAGEVAREVDRRLDVLERREIARTSLERYGAIFVVESTDKACELVNLLAPEHVELMTSDNSGVASSIRNAGAIFFGEWSTEPVGDYLAGPSHVLPTMTTARFSSPLGVYDFQKRQSTIAYTRSALERNAATIMEMARSEGLTGHGRAVEARLGYSRSSFEETENESAAEQVKPAVKGISAYTLSPHRAAVKINQNENPYDLPEEIKAEVFERLRSRAWSRYPEFVPSSLLARLAEFSGWVPEGTLAGNGSNELIQATLMASVDRGTRVVIPVPTFTLYQQIVTVLGGQVVPAPLKPSFRFDPPAIEEACRNADILILCSPNNPTGCVINAEDLSRIAAGFNGLIVVDEAYHEFSGTTVLPLLREHSNLIVLRTFSKAMSMAALRVGYLLSSPDLVREIHKATLPYSINVFSTTAAEVVCERFESIRPRIDLIVSERERLQRELGSIPGVEVVPSSANFFLIRSPLQPRRLFEELLERDILVRDVSGYRMLSEYLRISVGSPDENDRLLNAMTDIFGGGGEDDVT